MPRHPYPPLPDSLPEFPANSPLNASLVDLVCWWIEMRCQCGRSAAYPFRLMAAERGWHVKLSEILPKLKCQKCGEASVKVDLIDSPQHGGTETYGSVQKRLELK